MELTCQECGKKFKGAIEYYEHWTAMNERDRQKRSSAEREAVNKRVQDLEQPLSQNEQEGEQ